MATVPRKIRLNLENTTNRTGNGVYVTWSGDEFDEPIVVDVLDGYDQLIASLEERTALIREDSLGSLTNNLAEFVNGQANFKSLIARHTPGENMSATITASISTLFSPTDLIPVVIVFRECDNFQYLNGQICVNCPPGKYASPPDCKVRASQIPVIGRVRTQDCPQGSTCDGTENSLSSIRIKRGFYRTTVDSEDVYRCFNKAACVGGEAVGSGLCRNGHAGLPSAP